VFRSIVTRVDLMALTADELKHQANLLIPWHRLYVSRSGVRFGDGQVPVDTEKTTYVRECLVKLGGSIKSAIDLGSYEGYHSIQLAELPGVERVVGLEGRARNVAKANLVNQALGYDTVRFHVFDLEQLGRTPTPESGPFDLVFCAGLLYHMSQPWEVVAWMSANSRKYLFLDTHYADLSLYRCGPYAGEVYPEMDTETCGLKSYAFWPTLGDLFMMLLQHQFVPRFVYRYSAGHSFQPRIWIFAEKADSSAELDGINPLRPDARENFPPLSAGPQPSSFNSLEAAATSIKAGAVQPISAETALRRVAEAELSAAKAELANILASRSWRLTAPLRKINSLLRTYRGS
jgi:Methyltransferase domain